LLRKRRAEKKVAWALEQDLWETRTEYAKKATKNEKDSVVYEGNLDSRKPTKGERRRGKK